MNIILLKHGEKYTAKDVNDQAESLLKHADYPIYCLTEDSTDVEIECIPIPRKPKLQKWWNKLHVFRGDFALNGRCCLFDLDIGITSNPFPYIEEIDWRVPHFIEDYWKQSMWWNDHAYETMLNSSVMAWDPGRNTEYWWWFEQNIDYNTRKYRGIDRYIWDHKFNYGTFDNEIHSSIVL